jgi:hypothetical protein
MVQPTLSKREHVLWYSQHFLKENTFYVRSINALGFSRRVFVCVCVCVLPPQSEREIKLRRENKRISFFLISILLTRVVTAITSRVYLNTVFQLRPTRRSEEWRFGGSGDMGQLVYHYWTTTRVYLNTVPPPPPVRSRLAARTV